MGKAVVFLVTVLVLVSSIPCRAEEDSSTTAGYLIVQGWEVHESRNFASVSQRVLADCAEEKDQYVYDTGGFLFSRAAGRIVRYDVYDRLTTPHREMYGDIVFLTDPENGELLELRWFDGEKRHLIFNGERQKRVTGLVPIVINSLF